MIAGMAETAVPEARGYVRVRGETKRVLTSRQSVGGQGISHKNYYIKESRFAFGGPSQKNQRALIPQNNCYLE